MWAVPSWGESVGSSNLAEWWVKFAWTCFSQPPAVSPQVDWCSVGCVGGPKPEKRLSIVKSVILGRWNHHVTAGRHRAIVCFSPLIQCLGATQLSPC